MLNRIVAALGRLPKISVAKTKRSTATFKRVTLNLEFIPPTGYTFTFQNAGSDDDLDSDVNPATNKTAEFELDNQQEIDNINAGLDGGDLS